ncbi:transcription factor stalky isoform X2 [Vespula pensylvanica]|nr:transcription factor stalky isoform X2 [Vespula pensylvanica]
MHLHVEIENLRQRLLERDNHIITMETQFLNEAEKFPNGELASIKEEILIWQEKYQRLYEAHKRVQKVNQNLEDKLLRIVDKCESEKGTFTKDIATLSHRLADANYTIHRLTQDNERYRNDVNLAIQLLQCKPSNFVGQKYDSLPTEVQAKVQTYIAHKRCSKDSSPPNMKSIIVPISTFPPTAMVYNVSKQGVEKHSDEDDVEESKPPVDIVSAAIMAKVLEDREKERIFAKHCDTCTCHKSILLVDAECQTVNNSDACNECTLRHVQIEEKHSEYVNKINKSFQSRSNQNSNANSIFQKHGQDAIDNGNIHFHNNSDCTKYSNSMQYLYNVKDNKLAIKSNKSLADLRDDNKKDSMRQDNMEMHMQAEVINNDKQTSLKSNRNTNMSSNIITNIPTLSTTSVTFNNITSTNTAININGDKSKQTRTNRKSDFLIDSKSNTSNWVKYEKETSSCSYTMSENTTKYFSNKEQTQIDIINDRLWKNEWIKIKSDTNTKDRNNDNITNDAGIDIINSRDWKNNRMWTEPQNPAHLTLIEVKNIDNVMGHNDCRQVEIATSPSFSSDSVVISTSDPPSSSSDILQSSSGVQSINSVNNQKSNSHNHTLGSRSCLVRLTHGSKNVLIDNDGHCKATLFTNANSKPNAALVHTKKAITIGSERSPAITSKKHSVLLQDSNQLQRVAEWVQSSVCIENSVQNNLNGLKISDNSGNKEETCLFTYANEKSSNHKSFQLHSNQCHDINEKEELNKEIDGNKEIDSLLPVTSVGSMVDDKDKDLITFDIPNEDEKSHSSVNDKNSNDNSYEVKITREMEETYLKLAASLDPVTLSLSDANNSDITIEKYRKNYKRLHAQRSHDKVGSMT